MPSLYDVRYVVNQDGDVTTDLVEVESCSSGCSSPASNPIYPESDVDMEGSDDKWFELEPAE